MRKLSGRLVFAIGLVLLCTCVLFTAPVRAEEYPVRELYGEYYYPWTDTATLPSTPGRWYLVNDVTQMTDCWIVPGDETVLDLNGHRIWRRAIGQDPSQRGNVIRIPKNSKLSLFDSSGNNSRIAGGSAWQGGCIYNAGELNIDGVTLGGDSVHNANVANAGGAVYNESGAYMTMSGGIIENNRALQTGGGAIWNNGTLTITGGTIIGNTTDGDGGGILNAGYLRMRGGISITGNSAGGTGGGIRVISRSKFYILGEMYIQNNTNSSGAASNVTLVDGAVINVSDWLDELTRIGISVSDIDDDIDNIVVCNDLFDYGISPENFFSDSSWLAVGLNADGDLILGVPVNMTVAPGSGTGSAFTVRLPKGGVYMLPECTFTPPDRQEFIGWYVTGDSTHLRSPGEQITVTKATTVTACWMSSWSVLQQQIDNTAAGNVIVLASDPQGDSSCSPLLIPDWQNLTIDLNGHTISRSLTSAVSDGNVITIEGSLTVIDSKGGGTIAGGWNEGSGGGIVNLGTLTISGGTVTGNKAAEGGAVYNADSGILNLEGGSLTGNRATTYSGGAIVNRGIINMSSGTISGNTSKLNGAGIWTTGTVNLSGGAVTGNTAGSGQNGAGIYCSAGTMNLSGTPVVWENTPNNLYLKTQVIIHAVGALDSGLHIGISGDTWPAEGQPQTVMTGVTSYAGGVVSDRSIYLSAVSADGTMQMFVRPTFGTPNFTLPAELNTIEANAFEGAELVTVVDAHSCDAIGPEAFRDCAGLTQILLPVDCLIDPTAFSGCNGPVFVFAPAGGDTEASCAAILLCVFIGE